MRLNIASYSFQRLLPSGKQSMFGRREEAFQERTLAAAGKN